MALLKLSANGKASLVPIAILIDGKFWDASAYKASPVPFALEPGTVYEAERTGSSQGLFTIGAALHSNAANASVPWLATGAYVPAGSDTEKKVLHAEATPVGIDNSDAPPRLTKNPDANAAPASGTPSKPSPSPSSSAPSSSGSSAPSSRSGSGSGDEPPRLSRPASSQTPPADSAPSSTSTPAPVSGTQNGSGPPSSGQSPSNQNSSGQNPSGQTGSGQTGSNQPSTSTAPQSGNKPADSKSDGKSDTAKSDTKPADHENVPTSDSGAGGANRPRLRRGKPATSFADEDVPGYSKPGATQGIISSVTAKPAPAAAAEPVQLIPAISDSAGPQPRSYGFEWLQGDEADRRKQLIALVQEKVRGYVEAQVKATVAPKPAPGAASHRASAKKTPEPVLSNVQMTTYDLWSTNQPIVIFSADAQMPTKSAPPAAKSTTSSRTLSAMPQKSSPTASSGSASSGPSSSASSSSGLLPNGSASNGSADTLQYSVVVVAYPDIYNNLHTLYAGVTDKYHLDITPRLELIDAVDADGDGRGELLFRETSDAGTGWVIYRASADKLWKMFDSLNPE